VTLDALEFISRFLQHTLPPKFHKVRFFGFFSPSYSTTCSSLRLELLKLNPYSSLISHSLSPNLTPTYLHICPICKIGILRTIGHIYFRKKSPFYYRPPPHDNIKTSS
jgi:hypothetical protein